jgi:hypothetical protein
MALSIGWRVHGSMRNKNQGIASLNTGKLEVGLCKFGRASGKKWLVANPNRI